MSSALGRAIRYTFREPVLAVFCILLLALGMGSLSSGVDILAAYLVDPTPFTDAPRLVRVWGSTAPIQERGALSYGDLRDAHVDALEALSAFAGHRSVLEIAPGRRQSVDSASVDADFFQIFGVETVAGRSFDAEEGRAGRQRVCVVSRGLWRRVFQNQDFSPGRQIKVDGFDCLVLGVIAEDFDFPLPSTEIWLPLEQGPLAALTDQPARSFGAVGKLRESTRLGVLDQQLDAVMASKHEEGERDDERISAWSEHLDEVYLQRVEDPLRFLGLGTLFVFFAAVLNVALIQLVRSSSRIREAAIRFSIGATRARMTRTFLRDAGLLAGLAALLALPVGWYLARTITKASGLGGSLELELWPFIAGSIVGFLVLFVLSLLTFRVGRDPMKYLKGRVDLNLGPWKKIASIQVSLAFLLLLASVSFLASYHDLIRVETGFDAEDLYYAEILLPEERYTFQVTDPESWANNHQKIRDMLSRVRQIPSLRESTVGMAHPTAAGWTRRYSIPGMAARGGQPRVRIRVVADRYFDVVGTSVLRGRPIEARDVMGARPVALVNEAAREELFLGEEPIGRTIEIMGMEREIIGVVADVTFLGIHQPPEPAIYTSLFQTPTGWFFLITRTEMRQVRASQEIVSAIHSVDRGLAVPELGKVSEPIRRFLDFVRSGMILSSATAAIIVILAILGLYGLMRASAVSWRREMAMRLTLGATRRQVLLLVLGRSFRVLLWGGVFGVLGGMLLEKLLLSTAEWVRVDPWAYGVAGLICAVLGFAGSLGPALRVAGLEPAEVLRTE